MNKKRLGFPVIAIFTIFFLSSSCVETSNGGTSYLLTLDFSGPSSGSNTVYACWIENENGDNIRNFYICNKLISGGLTGIAIPYWKTVKQTQNPDVDDVTGASVQGKTGLNVTRTFDFGSAAKIRVCFEIDRSWNGNDYFPDRPCFIYKTELITLSGETAAYDLHLYGWMSNASSDKSLSQQPKVPIPGYDTYKLMTDTSYLADTAGSYDDMVLQSHPVTVTIAKP